MSIYIVLVAATLLLSFAMPQKGKKRLYYIVIMAVIHAFVLGFRYNHLTGDLMKYHFIFNNTASYGWFSKEIIQEGRNTGFMMLMKLINEMTDADFQVLLVVIAVITHVVLAYVIYKYSPAPWMSFLAWNCMAFYIFGFSAIKQALAMAFVMLAFVGIAERRFKLFLVSMIAAGLIHVPALIFLPAYWMTKMRVNWKTVLLYVFLGILLYIFKNQFVNFIRSFYYEEDEVFFFSGDVGNRFIMLLGFTLFGILFKGFPDRNFEKLFHLMAIATILQMLSGFDNIFTRLTDYYFQFSVLYIPMIFFSSDSKPQRSLIRPVFPFNERSLKVLAILICLFMLWFYWTYNIDITIEYSVDDYLNFRFMWDVK